MQQSIDMRQLQKILDSHASEITTLQCLVAGLYRHIKSTQGEAGASAAIELALGDARAFRPFSSTKPSIERIQRLGEIIKQ